MSEQIRCAPKNVGNSETLLNDAENLHRSLDKALIMHGEYIGKLRHELESLFNEESCDRVENNPDKYLIRWTKHLNKTLGDIENYNLLSLDPSKAVLPDDGPSTSPKQPQYSLIDGILKKIYSYISG